MCINCNDSLQVNLPIGPSGTNGTNGSSAYVYIAYADDAAGNGFSTNPSGKNYIAIINSTTPIATPTAANFAGQWHLWTGATGAAGTNGTNGTNGINGAFSFKYYWNTNTAASDPGYTFVKLNNNTNVNNATQIYISHKDQFSNQVVTPLYYSYGGTASTIKSFVTISKQSDSSVFATYRVTGGALSGAYYTLNVIGLAASSNTPFSANDPVVFSFSVVGDVGATGATGPIGPQGATGPQGPAGAGTSLNLVRPGSPDFDIDFNTSMNTNFAVTTRYYQYSATTTTPTAGLIQTLDSTGATTTVVANIVQIRISGTEASGGAYDYSGVLQYISSTKDSGALANFVFTNTTTSLTTSFYINQATWTSGSPGYLTLYVSGGSGTAFVTGATGKYDLYLSTDYQLTLANKSYNRVLLKNLSGATKVVRFNAPATATPGSLMTVEAVADTGNANLMNLAYVRHTTGANQTLVEHWEYANRASNGNLNPVDITTLKLNTATDSCLMHFMVVQDVTSPYRTSLAYIGGDQFIR